MKPTAIDAFCGAGGLTLGLLSSGFSVQAAFDFDPICIKSLRHNSQYIDHPLLESNITDLLGGRLLSLTGINRGELDLLAGGPPCQGFSIQRTVGGEEDARNVLLHDYGDLIEEVLPKFFIVENVPGIGGSRGRAILAKFDERMKSLGYETHHAVLDAQDFGVPQRRRRYIVVGEFLTHGSQSHYKWPIPDKNVRLTVRMAIGDLPSPPADGSEHFQIANHRADKLTSINKERIASLKPGQGRVDLPPELQADCHRISADITGHRNVYGRMDFDAVAPTITARFDSFTRGQFGHPTELRSISLREGARLQTFPDDFVFLGTKVQVARQIGNAIPPKFAEAIAKSIMSALQAQDKTSK